MGQTITEKIFAAHLRDTPTPGNMVLDIDVIMCHEITTPIAIMDLMDKGMDRVCDPSRIKAVIDHVTPPKDSKTAAQAKIMREWARRHNIRDFFDIGRNGVCHALFPEKGFIRPGNTVIMGDSHTCTHGAFGAFAAGVGTTDLEVAIYKGVCAFRTPKSIKIEVTGTLPRGVFAKDVILTIIKQLTMGGGTDMVIEFTGPVVDAMNMASRMTLCNMAVEAGATSGVCQPDLVTAEYLWPFIKDDYASPPRRPNPSPAALGRRRALRARAHRGRDQPDAPGHLRVQAGQRQGHHRNGRQPGGPGVHRLLHQRPHRGPARGRRHPPRPDHRQQRARHPRAGHPGRLLAGP